MPLTGRTGVRRGAAYVRRIGARLADEGAFQTSIRPQRGSRAAHALFLSSSTPPFIPCVHFRNFDRKIAHAALQHSARLSGLAPARRFGFTGMSFTSVYQIAIALNVLAGAIAGAFLMVALPPLFTNFEPKHYAGALVPFLVGIAGFAALLFGEASCKNPLLPVKSLLVAMRSSASSGLRLETPSTSPTCKSSTPSRSICCIEFLKRSRNRRGRCSG